MSEPNLRLRGVANTYGQGDRDLHVLNGVDLEIPPGEIIALVGPSGTGKSTLLHIAGLLDRADKGEVAIAGRDVFGLGDAERTRLRRAEVGFVYQFHHLLQEFSARENVAMPCLIAGKPYAEAEARADDLLAQVGLADRASHRPAELSGGEQQRVAICRALANSPRLLLADEPTGNLDPETSDQVFAHLIRLVRETGLSALIATHNLDLAARMDRIVTMSQGRLTQDQATATP